MRKLIATFLIYTLNAYAVPPVSVDSEQSAVGNYVQNTKLPNEQATQLTQRNTRVETGNSNLLKNPSFEHMTLGFGWTISNATYSLNTTNQVEGKKALNLTPTGAMVAFQDSTINAANIAGLQGVASVKIKATGTTGLKVCPRNAGTAVANLCVNVAADNTWKHVSIPFILGTTSNGIGIATTATGGTVIVDDAFVGTSAPFQDVSGARLYGSISMSGCSSTGWSTTSTTYVTPTTTGCIYTTSGNVSAPTTMIPGFRLLNAPAGSYYIVSRGLTLRQDVNDQGAYSQWTDGTTNQDAGTVFVGATAQVNSPAWSPVTYTYSTTADRSLNLQIHSSGAGLTARYEIVNPPVIFDVYYFPPATKIYSSTAVVGSTLTSPTLFTMNIGATTTPPTKSVSPGIDKATWYRVGNKMAIDYTYTQSSAGSNGSGVYLFSLPSGYSIDTTNIQLMSAPTANLLEGSIVGYGHTGNTGAVDTSVLGSCMLKPYSTTQLAAVCKISSLGSGSYWLGSTAGFGFGAANFNVSFHAEVPISGWNIDPVFIGSFAGLEKCANDYECTDTFSAHVDTTGVVTGENIDWINGNCIVTASSTACTYNTNLKDGTSSLSGRMNCVATLQNLNVTAQNNIFAISSNSSTGFTFLASQPGVGNSPREFDIKCQKGSQDYKPKTAKVATTTDVVTIQGSGKPVIYAGLVSAAGVVTPILGGSLFSSCSYGSPVALRYNCSVVSGKLANASYVCMAVNNAVGNSRIMHFDSASTVTNAIFGEMNTNTLAFASDTAFFYTCTGVAP